MLCAARLLSSARRGPCGSRAGARHLGISGQRSNDIIRIRPTVSKTDINFLLRKRAFSQGNAPKSVNALEKLRSEIEAIYGPEIAADPEVQAILAEPAKEAAIERPDQFSVAHGDLPVAFLSRREIDLLQSELEGSGELPDEVWQSDWAAVSQAAGAQIQREHLEPVMSFLEALPSVSARGTAAAQQELASVAASQPDIRAVLERHADSLPEPVRKLVTHAHSPAELRSALSTVSVQRLSTILAQMELSEVHRARVADTLRGSSDTQTTLSSLLQAEGLGTIEPNDTRLSDLAAAVRARGSPEQLEQLASLERLRRERVQSTLEEDSVEAELLPPSREERDLFDVLQRQVELLLQPLPEDARAAATDHLSAAARKVASEKLLDAARKHDADEQSTSPVVSPELVATLGKAGSPDVEKALETLLHEGAETSQKQSSLLTDLEVLLHDKLEDSLNNPSRAQRINALLHELARADPASKVALEARLSKLRPSGSAESAAPEVIKQDASVRPDKEAAEAVAAGEAVKAATADSTKEGEKDAEELDDEDFEGEEKDELVDELPAEEDQEPEILQEGSSVDRPPLPDSLEPASPFSTDLPDHRYFGEDPRLPYRRVLKKLFKLFEAPTSSQPQLSLSTQLLGSIAQDVYQNPNATAALAAFPTEKLHGLLSGLENLAKMSSQLASQEDRVVAELLKADLDDSALRSRVNQLIAQEQLRRTAISPLQNDDAWHWEEALELWRKRFRNDPEYEAGRQWLEARRLQTLLSEGEEGEEGDAETGPATADGTAQEKVTKEVDGGPDDEEDDEAEDVKQPAAAAKPVSIEDDAPTKQDPEDIALDQALVSGAPLTAEQKTRLKQRHISELQDEKAAWDEDEQEIQDLIRRDPGEFLGEITQRQNIATLPISIEQALKERSSRISPLRAQSLFNSIRPQRDPFNDTDLESRARHAAVARAYEEANAEFSQLFADIDAGKPVDATRIEQVKEHLQAALAGAEHVLAAEKMRDPSTFHLQEALRVVTKYLPEDGDVAEPLLQSDWEAEDRRLLEDLARSDESLPDPTGELAWSQPNRIGLRPRDYNPSSTPFEFRSPIASPEQRYQATRVGVDVAPSDPLAAQLHDLHVRHRRGEISDTELQQQIAALVPGNASPIPSGGVLGPLDFGSAPSPLAADVMHSWIAQDRNWRSTLNELDESQELTALAAALEGAAGPSASSTSATASAAVAAPSSAHTTTQPESQLFGSAVKIDPRLPLSAVMAPIESPDTLKLRARLSAVQNLLGELEERPNLVEQQSVEVYSRWMAYVLQCRERVRLAEGRSLAHEALLPSRRHAGAEQPKDLADAQIGHWEELLHRMLLPAIVFTESDFPEDVRAEVENEQDEIEQLANFLSAAELRTFIQRKRDEENARVATLMTVAEQEAWRQRKRVKNLYRHWQRAKRQQWAALIAQREQLQRRLSDIQFVLAEPAAERARKDQMTAAIDKLLGEAIPDSAKSIEALQNYISSGGRGVTPSAVAEAQRELWDRLSGNAGPLHEAATASERIRQRALDADLESLKPPADAPADQRAEHQRLQELLARFRQQLSPEGPTDPSSPGFGLKSLAQDQQAITVARQLQEAKQRLLAANLRLLEAHFVTMWREKRSLVADQQLLARQAQLMVDREMELQAAKHRLAALPPGTPQFASQQLAADQLEHKQRQDMKALQHLKELVDAREHRVAQGLHPSNLKHLVHLMSKSQSDEVQQLETQLKKMAEQRLDEDEKLQRTAPLPPGTKPDSPEALVHRLRTQQDQKPKSTSLADLKFFRAYPPRVQEWILDAKLPKGGFTPSGRWGVLPETEQDRFDDLVRVNPKPRLAVDPDTPVAPDLEGHFRFGVMQEDLTELNIDPKLRALLSFRYANKWEINDFRRQQAIKKWQRTSYDTGSTEVQIAILSDRINYLSEHTAKHHKDKASARKLRIMINKRRRFLRYMREQDAGVYQRLIKDLNIRDYAWLAPPA